MVDGCLLIRLPRDECLLSGAHRTSAATALISIIVALSCLQSLHHDGKNIDERGE